MGTGSIQLARIFGIRIGASPSWFVVLFIMILALSSSYDDRGGEQENRAEAEQQLAREGEVGQAETHRSGSSAERMCA